MKKNVFLIISLLLVILGGTTFGYLYFKNNEVEKEVKDLNKNINKVQKIVDEEQKEITEKQDEYEKLKDKVKLNLEELNIWEELKEELNKSLS